MVLKKISQLKKHWFFVALAGAFLFFLFSFLSYRFFNPPFSSLSNEDMLERLVRQKRLAIERAVAAGDYRCCLEPSCSMCYLQANQWNNFKAGTCACDDLIVKGEEPCPQCQEGLCLQHKQEGKSCELE
jgi:hypothetical protein